MQTLSILCTQAGLTVTSCRDETLFTITRIERAPHPLHVPPCSMSSQMINSGSILETIAYCCTSPGKTRRSYLSSRHDDHSSSGGRSRAVSCFRALVGRVFPPWCRQLIPARRTRRDAPLFFAIFCQSFASLFIEQKSSSHLPLLSSQQKLEGDIFGGCTSCSNSELCVLCHHVVLSAARGAPHHT